MTFGLSHKEDRGYHSHIYFSNLAESLILNKHLRKFLSNIDAMVLNAENPPISSNFIMNLGENSLSPAATLGYELVKERLRGDALDIPQEIPEKGVGVRPLKPKTATTDVSELKQIRTKILDIFKNALPADVLNQKVYPNIGFTTDPAALASLTERNDNLKANSVGFADADTLRQFLLSNKMKGMNTSEPCQLKHTPAFFTSILKNKF